MKIPVYSFNTVIVGSGAASLNCAIHLFENGQKNIAIVTDFLGGGTSANTGSDKQTYYKLALSGNIADSPCEMAKTLFDGGAMDGDIALVEATLSIQEFYHLVQLGVKFPHNIYGSYVGYKTDHDSEKRGISVGPLTSQNMFKCLLSEVKKRKIKIFDRYEVIKLLTSVNKTEKRVIGCIAIDKQKINNSNMGMVLFNCKNIVLGTGGPAGIYKNSVYPKSQIGSIGLALEIGANARNLGEFQYGIASIKFRWNLSGTYQQVIPRYFSTNQDGNDEQDFLNKYFPTMDKLATAIFLKGYQWPFDVRKIKNYGSSLIDLLVYQETEILGRRIFLDFTKNPQPAYGLKKFKFEDLSSEAYEYLKKSNALLSTPIDRLKSMNYPAIELYKSYGIDIIKTPLEIEVCVQHNNGGLGVNIWWESNIRHLFPVGEIAGTHGIYRPGGAALNSGQVGGFRAAEFISEQYIDEPQRVEKFMQSIKNQVADKINGCKNIIINFDDVEFKRIREEIQKRMSKYGAYIRSLDEIKKALKSAYILKDKLDKMLLRGIHHGERRSNSNLLHYLKTKELCRTHIFYLEAMKFYLKAGGGSRGSYLVKDKNGILFYKGISEKLRFKKIDTTFNDGICETYLNSDKKIKSRFVKIKSIPKEEFWFENVWKKYQ